MADGADEPPEVGTTMVERGNHTHTWPLTPTYATRASPPPPRPAPSRYTGNTPAGIVSTRQPECAA